MSQESDPQEPISVLIAPSFWANYPEELQQTAAGRRSNPLPACDKVSVGTLRMKKSLVMVIFRLRNDADIKCGT